MLRATCLILLLYSFLFLMQAETIVQDDVKDAIKTKADAAKDLIEDGIENVVDNNKDTGGDLEKECLEATGEYYTRIGKLKIKQLEIGLSIKYLFLNSGQARNMTMQQINDKIDAAINPITGDWLKEKQNKVLDCLKDDNKLDINSL
ncbi:hypothetical protein O3M35_010441 [Rhynocoris fuscipes]|uniref:Uncharacterized protein n=1 Tax=Rhynocoris fuscipes TaxID=488301 RepID=A0AAW1D1P3_9HEMI